MPIALRGVAYGNLYLTEKAGGVDFTDDDEEAVVMLGSQAAVAIENARLYQSATRWSAQLESLNEVMNVLVTEFDLGRLLQLIATRLRDLLDARTVTIALPHGSSARIEAAAGEGGGTNVGLQLAQRAKRCASSSDGGTRGSPRCIRRSTTSPPACSARAPRCTCR